MDDPDGIDDPRVAANGRSEEEDGWDLDAPLGDDDDDVALEEDGI